MPDEDNPFMLASKPQKKEQEKTLSFGTDELISFMVEPGEVKDPTKLFDDTKRPHWERSGTPMWDKKNVDIDNPDYEVVDHDEKE